MGKMIIVILIAIVVIGGFFFYRNEVKPDTTAELGVPTTLEDDGSAPEMIVHETDDGKVIVYTDDGYSPATMMVKEGESVLFKNESSKEMWPATAMHPTHTVYPGSDIKKCSTEEANKLFDSCKGISVGDSWSFIFTEVGDWKYHDHLTGGKFGAIVVE